MNKLRKLRDLLIVILMLIGNVSANLNGSEIPSAFVRVKGMHFYRSGQPYYYTGTNFWYGCYLGSTESGRQRLIQELDQLKELGITNLRVLAGSEASISQRALKPAVQSEPGVYNEDLLQGLDFLLAEMAKRDMLAVVFLNNYWEWSGGMAQYQAWYDDQPMVDPHVANDWSGFMAYSARFYRNQKANETFHQFIRKIVLRKNTLTGKVYKNDPTIMAWELANEPRPGPDGDIGRANVPAFYAWIKQTASFIKSLDKNHLVTTGSEGVMGCIKDPEVFLNAHRFKDIDYTTFHLWAKNWGWFEADQIEETLPSSMEKAKAYVRQHIDLAQQLNKPIVLEEFGMERDGGYFSADTATTARDRYFTMLYDLVYENAAKGGPLVGTNVWAWGGGGRAQQVDAMWQPGDPFTGDPPQEHQGLNSIFDEDKSTLDILHRHSQKMASLGRKTGGGQSQPNVIIIYTDDHELSQIASYGGKVLTPHMDRLAKEGLKLDRFYVTSAVCSPSRYSALTGRYAGHCPHLQTLYPTDQPAMLQWNTEVSVDEWTLAKVLQQAGYVTGMVGKWHLGQPIPESALGNADANDPALAKQVAAQYRDCQSFVRNHGGFDVVEGLYINNLHANNVPKAWQQHNMEWVTQGAVNFITDHKDSPFFLYMATTIPHGPSPIASMEADPRLTPSGLLEEVPQVQPSRDSVFARVKQAGLPRGAAALTWMDDGIGAVLDKLDELGLTENTLVILASDNGTRSGKMTCYDTGALMPCLIRWPGRCQAGQVCDELAANIDIVPTVLEACQVLAPEDMSLDGYSLIPWFQGAKQPLRDSLMLEVTYQKAVVTKDWKYIAGRYPTHIQSRVTPENRELFSWTGIKKEPGVPYWLTLRYGADEEYPSYYDADQLFHLKNDPQEQKNLAENVELVQQLKTMQTLLGEHVKPLPHHFAEFTSK